MHITVRLFASHREAAGVGEIVVALPAGARAGDALAACRRAHPALPPSDSGIAFAINRAFAGPETALADGDEVAVFPPVAGG
jgi:molybdopterin converting factor small subunit